MTAATIATPLPPAERRRSSIGRRYGRLWANVPRELGYLALTALIGFVTYAVMYQGLRLGGGTGGLLLAVVLSALLLVAARYLGALELTRLGWARTPAIRVPRWSPVLRGKRFLRAVGDVFGNGHYWLYAIHSLVVNPLLAIATSAVWFGWLLASLVLSSCAVWSRIVVAPTGAAPVYIGGHYGDPAFTVNGRSVADSFVLALTDRSDPAVAALWTAGLTAVGLLALALLPLVLRGATLAHWSLAKGLLGRFRTEDLRQDVARADAARTAAIAAEDSALRRLERDIHDGPQQRLLALQMELSTAERRLGTAEATESIAAARRLAAETLDELRALAQGFAPPLLQDRGLSAALGALGRRGAVPVDTAIAIDGALPDALERSVYFVAAELVTNAMKHAGATRIRLDARTEQGELRIAVSDDGAGGAQVVPGHGLAGIADRLAGLGGTLDVASPEGGPTTVAARVPLP